MKFLPKQNQTEPLDTNIKKTMRMALAIILIFFFGFIIWAAVAPLSSGVVVPGVVKTISHVQLIQSPYTSMVKQINIKEGQKVKKNELLIKLDDSQAKALFSKSQNQYFYLLALKARLQAQETNAAKINFPKELTQLESNPNVANLIQTQTQLFYSTMENIQTQKNALLSQMTGLQAQKLALSSSLQAMKSQLNILQSQINSLEPITNQGYYPKNQFLDKKRQYLDLKANYDNVQGQINNIDAQISQTKSKLENLQAQFLSDTQSELSKADSQCDSAKQEYLAAKIALENTSIKSPVDGEILYLAVHTPDAIVGQGQEIIQILPSSSKFIIETQIPPQDIAKVHVGSKASLLFSALNIHTTPEVDGKVIYVSPAALTDEKAKTSYYIARVELTKSAVKTLSGKQIKPGMPVIVKVKSGAKTMLQYLLNPLIENFHTSVRE
ncbi:MAG: HlyD family type I secretion periplasmic adaptor subunit [Candidatus Micrarchaeaceae archaeon]